MFSKGFFLRIIQPITRQQIFDSSKLKEFADNKFKFDVNGRKLSKWVENTVGKGGIARYEQFLLFPQCFQRACFPGASKGVIVWEWVNSNLCGKGLTSYHTIKRFNKVLKILREKEKILVTRFSAFSHNFFYPSLHELQLLTL